MNRTKQIKSLFLLVVFSMHTLVGLACSVGFVFGSKKGHHDDVTSSYSHEKVHQHEKAKPHSHDHGNISGKVHSHDGSVPPHDHSSTGTHESSEKDDDCCTDQVVKISSVDKVLSSGHPSLSPPSTLLVFTLYTFLLSPYNHIFGLLKPKPPNPRSWPLATHTDLRIAIQSFQI